MRKEIEELLRSETAYRIAKDLGINARTVNRYQNGESPIDNMTFQTAEKLYQYFMETRGGRTMAKFESLKDFTFEGKVIEHAGWSGGDVPENNLYKQFYTDKRESLKDGFNHYAVWWDLSEFAQAEEERSFKWPAPHAVVLEKDAPESTYKYFESLTQFGEQVTVDGHTYTIINQPIRFAPTGYSMLYWAGAVDAEGEVYKVYWNIFNMIDPSKIELTVDNSRQCTHCLKPWTLNDSKCVNSEGHEYE